MVLNIPKSSVNVCTILTRVDSFDPEGRWSTSVNRCFGAQLDLMKEMFAV